ncbi:MAG TPA: TorF family putative porin, partial [Longimicrobium sp.]|nr:TorF family putative porin [Longimicrobium sp.]
PWATVSLGSTGVSLTAWASFAVTDRDRIVPYSTTLTRGGTDEVDLTAAFSRAVGPVAVGAGYIAYIYPSDEQAYTTQEVYGTLGLATVPLTLSVFYDFDGGDAGNVDAIEGLYASLSVARSIPVGVPLVVDASIGYTDQEALRADAGLNDASVSLATAIPVGRFVITPAIVYTRLFDGAVVAEDGDDTVWARLQLKLAL